MDVLGVTSEGLPRTPHHRDPHSHAREAMRTHPSASAHTCHEGSSSPFTLTGAGPPRATPSAQLGENPQPLLSCVAPQGPVFISKADSLDSHLWAESAVLTSKRLSHVPTSSQHCPWTWDSDPALVGLWAGAVAALGAAALAGNRAGVREPLENRTRQQIIKCYSIT